MPKQRESGVGKENKNIPQFKKENTFTLVKIQ
jgi:hypothetical protein